MSEKYCILLRGINVNGITIKMDALKEAFYKLGFPGAKTILATGNVIITTSDENNGKQELKTLLSNGLGEYFHYDAHVIVRSDKDIENIFSTAQAIPSPDSCHNYVLLCDDQELLSELKKLFDSTPHMPQEQLHLLENYAFWIVPKGSTLNSVFGAKVLGAKKYKSRLTSRNINTLEKIHKAMT